MAPRRFPLSPAKLRTTPRCAVDAPFAPLFFRLLCAIVMRRAQGLPIATVPEAAHVATVRNDVVDDCRLFIAPLTLRVSLQERCALSLPSRVVTTLACAWTLVTFRCARAARTASDDIAATTNARRTNWHGFLRKGVARQASTHRARWHDAGQVMGATSPMRRDTNYETGRECAWPFTATAPAAIDVPPA